MSILHQFVFARFAQGQQSLESHQGDSASSDSCLALQASSATGQDLEAYRRQLEPLLASIPLPSSLRPTDDAASRESTPSLFFVPMGEDMQVIGQISLLPSDSQDTPPGVLIHVVLRDARPAGDVAAASSPAAEVAASTEASPSPATASTGESSAATAMAAASEDVAAELPSQPEADDAATDEEDDVILGGATIMGPAESSILPEYGDALEEPPPTSLPSEERRWTAIEGLQLWQAAGWIRESRSGDPLLEPFGSLASVLQGKPAAIDDRVFFSFLKEPEQGGAFFDPAAIVPERWRAMDPQRRAEWFAEVFTRFVQTGGGELSPVVVAAEPSVAAIVFYGIARLLPAGALRNHVSLSISGPLAGPASAALVGTWDGAAAVSEAASGDRPAPIDTRRLADPANPAIYAPYATSVISRLRDLGWDAVDGELFWLGRAGVLRTEHLESHLASQRIVTSLLRTGVFATDAWRNTPAAAAMVREELVRRCEASNDVKATLKAVLGGPTHLTLIDLLANGPMQPAVRHAIVCLLEELPPAKIIGLLRLPNMADDDKIVTLARHIQKAGEFPPGCEFLWQDWTEAEANPKRAGVVLLRKVIARLSPKSLRKLYLSAPKRAATAFVLGLYRMHRANRLKAASISAVVRAMDEESMLTLLRQGGDEFLRSYPTDEPVMGEKLAEQLYALPKTPVQFRERLNRILAGQHLLPDEQHQTAATAWSTCCQLIPKISNLQKTEASSNPQARIALLEGACRDLAKAADQAMLLEPLNDTMTWEQKHEALLRIALEVLGGVPLLPKGPWEHDALLERIGVQLSKHRWPVDSIKKDTTVKKDAANKSHRLATVETPSIGESNRSLVFAIIGIVIIVTALLAWLLWWMIAPATRPQRKLRKRSTPRKRESVQTTRVEYFVGDAAPDRSRRLTAWLIADTMPDRLTQWPFGHSTTQS
jgi:hypothetical protein